MPDLICFLDRMKEMIREHEEREMLGYADLRDEMRRFHASLLEDRKEIGDRLTGLERRFDQSYAVIGLVKILAPIGAFIGGLIYWATDHLK